MIKNIQKKLGFTLIEIIVVVAIIATLLVLIISSAQKQRVKARDDVRIADLNTIRLSLEEYKLRCGQYPPKLKSGTFSSTGLCVASSGITLDDYLPQIPVDPLGKPELLLSEGIVKEPMLYGGYAYAGLSSRPNGPCFEYHIAAGLEVAKNYQNNNKPLSKRLSEDHDYDKYEGNFRYRCAGSANDYGKPGFDDDRAGLYDFRSTKNN